MYGQAFFNAVQFFAYPRAKLATLALTANEEQKQFGAAAQLTIPQFFMAGALTGFAVAFIEGPIDLFKTQLQTQVFQKQPLFTTFGGSVKHIASQYGVRGVFQGLGPTLARNIPAVSCYFGGYEAAKISLAKGKPAGQQLNAFELMAAGAMGGFAYWIFTYPIDVIKSTMQSDHPDPTKRRYPTMASTSRQLWAQSGVSAFYRGLTPCLLRAAPANAACFTLYELTSDFLKKAV